LLFESWFRGVFCTLPCALDDCVGLQGVENSAIKQPRTVWKWMDSADVTAFGCEPKGLRAYLKMGCSFGEVEPLDVPLLRRTVNWDLVVRPQCGYALSRPAIAMTGLELVPIENAGDQIIRGDSGQQPNRCDDVLRRAVALPAPTPWQAQFCMNATGPVSQEDDLASLGIDIRYYLFDQHANDALLQP
jgi:hypothetical protein